MTFCAYVFSSGTDLSTFTAVINARPNRIAEGANVSSSQLIQLNAGSFNDSGNLPVVLEKSDGSLTDISDPAFRTATVSFTNGNGTVDFSSFTPVVQGGGLTPDIDSALVGTSWKDNMTGSLITVVFAAGGITWGGSAGSILNTTTSAYQGTGYTFVWIAKDGDISYKYSYNNGPVYTAPVYTYVLSPGTLELKSGGITFATLIPM